MPPHPQVLYITSYCAHVHLLSFVCADFYSNKKSASFWAHLSTYYIGHFFRMTHPAGRFFSISQNFLRSAPQPPASRPQSACSVARRAGGHASAVQVRVAEHRAGAVEASRGVSRFLPCVPRPSRTLPPS